MRLFSLVVSCSISVAAFTPALAAPRPPIPIAGPGHRTPELLVRVVEAVSQRPLVNAEVIDLASGQHRFTGVQGETQLEWPSSGQLRLRVRQIGFQFVERAFTRAADATAPVDSVTVALDRVAYTLPEVVTTDAGRCATDAEPAAKLLSVSVLEQLRASAERYEAFRRAYPFRVEQERRTLQLEVDGKPHKALSRREHAYSDRWGDVYRPGRLIERSFIGFSIPILFLSTLADPVFWEHHCFVARGIETLNGARVVRLEFSPASNVKSADWEGAALVDSATSLLRRVEFRLTKLDERDQPRRLEGYTTFRSPSPLIVVPDSTAAIWWRRGPTDDGQWGWPDVVQVMHVEELRFRKGKPPAADTVQPPAAAPYLERPRELQNATASDATIRRVIGAVHESTRTNANCPPGSFIPVKFTSGSGPV